MFPFNVVIGRDDRFSSFYGKTDGARLRELLYTSHYSRKEFLCSRKGTYGKVIYRLSSEARASSGYLALN